MRLLSKELPPSHELILFGDNHRGNALEHREGFLSCVDYINHENRFAVHMGDAHESITIDDYRFDPITHATPPIHQANEVVADLWPIRKKMLTVLEGNHEFKLRKFGNLTEELARRLGTKYGTYSSILTITDKHGEMYKLFLAHGYGSINSTLDDPGDRTHAMKRSLRRKLMRKAGDCLIMAMGHTHKCLVVKPIDELYITSDKAKVHQHYVRQASDDAWIPPQQRWYVNTGSFLKLYGEGVSGYAEMAGYDPLEIGYIVIKVEDRQVVDIKRVIA